MLSVHGNLHDCDEVYIWRDSELKCCNKKLLKGPCGALYCSECFVPPNICMQIGAGHVCEHCSEVPICKKCFTCTDCYNDDNDDNNEFLLYCTKCSLCPSCSTLCPCCNVCRYCNNKWCEWCGEICSSKDCNLDKSHISCPGSKIWPFIEDLSNEDIMTKIQEYVFKSPNRKPKVLNTTKYTKA